MVRDGEDYSGPALDSMKTLLIQRQTAYYASRGYSEEESKMFGELLWFNEGRFEADFVDTTTWPMTWGRWVSTYKKKGGISGMKDTGYGKTFVPLMEKAILPVRLREEEFFGGAEGRKLAGVIDGWERIEITQFFPVHLCSPAAKVITPCCVGLKQPCKKIGLELISGLIPYCGAIVGPLLEPPCEMLLATFKCESCSSGRVMYTVTGFDKEGRADPKQLIAVEEFQGGWEKWGCCRPACLIRMTPKLEFSLARSEQANEPLFAFHPQADLEIAPNCFTKCILGMCRNLGGSSALRVGVSAKDSSTAGRIIHESLLARVNSVPYSGGFKLCPCCALDPGEKPDARLGQCFPAGCYPCCVCPLTCMMLCLSPLALWWKFFGNSRGLGMPRTDVKGNHVRVYAKPIGDTCRFDCCAFTHQKHAQLVPAREEGYEEQYRFQRLPPSPFELAKHCVGEICCETAEEEVDGVGTIRSGVQLFGDINSLKQDKTKHFTPEVLGFTPKTIKEDRLRVLSAEYRRKRSVDLHCPKNGMPARAKLELIAAGLEYNYFLEQ
jgi:hypothetical protein